MYQYLHWVAPVDPQSQGCFAERQNADCSMNIFKTMDLESDTPESGFCIST